MLQCNASNTHGYVYTNVVLDVVGKKFCKFYFTAGKGQFMF